MRVRQLFVVNWPELCVCHMWVVVSHVVEMRLWAGRQSSERVHDNVKRRRWYHNVMPRQMLCFFHFALFLNLLMNHIHSAALLPFKSS